MNSSWRPVPKVTAVALGGAAATLLVWLLDAARGLSVPPEAAAALTALLAFVFGYLKAPGDHLHHDDSEQGYALVELLVAAFFAVLIVYLLTRLL